MLSFSGVEELRKRLRRSDIQREFDHFTGDVGSCLLSEVDVEVADGDLGARGRERCCGGKSDTARRR